MIDYENNLIVEAQPKSGTGFAIGLAIAIFVLAGAAVSFFSPLIASGWKLLDLIPLSVLFFSGVGGMSHALYEFRRSRGGFFEPIREFVITPVFGIIAGSILYLTLEAGLVFIGTTAESNQPLFAVIAFTGGFFCDKPIGIIENLANTLQKSQGTNVDKQSGDKDQQGGDQGEGKRSKSDE